MDEELIVEMHFEVRLDIVLDTKKRYKVTLDEKMIVKMHFEVRLDEVLDTKNCQIDVG